MYDSKRQHEVEKKFKREMNKGVDGEYPKWSSSFIEVSSVTVDALILVEVRKTSIDQLKSSHSADLQNFEHRRIL